jgi:hypothetical protein
MLLDRAKYTPSHSRRFLGCVLAPATTPDDPPDTPEWPGRGERAGVLRQHRKRNGHPDVAPVTGYFGIDAGEMFHVCGGTGGVLMVS